MSDAVRSRIEELADRVRSEARAAR
jgi:hypothetical protein